MIHHGQRLPFLLETSDHGLRIRAQLENLQGDEAANGLFLLRHVNDPRAAFSDLLEQLVMADSFAAPLRY